MSQQTLNIGALANDGTGDSLRTGATKINANFTELYSGYRELVTSDRSYFVATTGSDANNGTSGGTAFATIQKAIEVITRTLTVANGVTITISIADGTYTITTPVILHPFIGGGTVVIQGNTGSPGNVIVTSASVITGLFVANGPTPGLYQVTGMQLQGTVTTKPAFLAQDGGNIEFGIIRFNTGLSNHVQAQRNGRIAAISAYTVLGSATTHLTSTDKGLIRIAGITVTVTGTPAFTTFAQADDLSLIKSSGTTWSGAATGVRYNVIENSVIQTAGAGASHFPGNSSGTAATGGQYI